MTLLSSLQPDWPDHPAAVRVEDAELSRSALLAHPGVLEAAVVGEPDDDLGQRIVAYVVGAELDGVDLSGFVAEALSVHKRPREVRVVDDLPRNAMGKVQKKLLGGHGRG